MFLHMFILYSLPILADFLIKTPRFHSQKKKKKMAHANICLCTIVSKSIYVVLLVQNSIDFKCVFLTSFKSSNG